MTTKIDDLNGTLGEVLLEPTCIYTKSILSCMDNGITIKGLVHITGGGFYENIPRILPKNAAVKIHLNSFNRPTIFSVLQKEGDIDQREMYTTFNMGIGMIVFVDKTHADKAITSLVQCGEKPCVIGEVVPFSKEKVLLV